MAVFFAKSILAGKNYFCHSGFNRGKPLIFHQLAETFQPCRELIITPFRVI